jgi:hypothetical protein
VRKRRFILKVFLRTLWPNADPKTGFYVPYALREQAFCQPFSRLSGQWIPRPQKSNIVSNQMRHL